MPGAATQGSDGTARSSGYCKIRKQRHCEEAGPGLQHGGVQTLSPGRTTQACRLRRTTRELPGRARRRRGRGNSGRLDGRGEGRSLATEKDLVASAAAAAPLTKTQVRALVSGLKDVLAALADADPKLKGEAYAEFGIRVEYDPVNNRATVEAQPSSCTQVRVEGASSTMSTWPAIRGVLDFAAA